MLYRRIVTLPVLVFLSSPLVISDSDYAMVLCKLWNIFDIFGRNVEQDERTCSIQE